MAFAFRWPRFSDQFHADAIQMLNSALNKGNKPPVIADRIEVIELEMGSQPPELEIRDIGELTVDQFRGIFRLTYSGDAHLVLRTKVQANPLNHKQPDIHLMAGSRGMLAAKQPLVVPMLLRLSHFKLNSYVVLVVSKQKGITLVFKTDPLQNVDINSTFDSIAVIQKFIQREIEGQLRQMFREDLPGIIHRLSQQWFKAKVEAPYLPKRPVFSAASVDDGSFPAHSSETSSVPLPSSKLSPQMNIKRPRSTSGMSTASRRSTPAPAPSLPSAPEPPGPSTLPDIENFDPTYGMRPEGLPAKSLFGKFSRLFAPSKGLAELSEEPSEEEEDLDDEPADSQYWDDTIPASSSVLDSLPEENDTREFIEYETIPAVGGGMITRPRVYHSQSQINSPLNSPLNSPGGLPSTRPSPRHRPNTSLDYEPSVSSFRGGSLPSNSGRPSFRPSPLSNPYFPSYDPAAHSNLNYLETPRPVPHSPIVRANTLQRSQSHRNMALPTPPPSEPSISPTPIKRPLERRTSFSSSIPDSFRSGSPPAHGTFSNDRDPKIILRPSLNDQISKLSTLSHSNHTLSPYTRSLEHFTVRSVPPRGSSGPSGYTHPSDRQSSVKARRKRIYHIGGASKKGVTLPQPVTPEAPLPSIPPSEFDADDMDRYFKWRDEVAPHFPPDIHPSHVHSRRSQQQL